MVICSHNPLVPGSSPGGPTRKQNPHQQSWGFCLLGVTMAHTMPEIAPILARIDCSQSYFRPCFL